METGKILEFQKYGINNKGYLTKNNKSITNPLKFVSNMTSVAIPLFGMFSPKICPTLVYNGLDNHSIKFFEKAENPIINIHKNHFKKFFESKYIDDMIDSSKEYKEFGTHIYSDSLDVFAPILVIVKKYDSDLFNYITSLAESGLMIICDLRNYRYNSNISSEIEKIENEYQFILFEKIALSGVMEE